MDPCVRENPTDVEGAPLAVPTMHQDACISKNRQIGVAKCSDKIAVDYRSDGPSWTRSVSDGGIGIDTRAHSPMGELGTGIVEGLARPLDARIPYLDATP